MLQREYSYARNIHRLAWTSQLLISFSNVYLRLGWFVVVCLLSFCTWSYRVSPDYGKACNQERDEVRCLSSWVKGVMLRCLVGCLNTVKEGF